MLSAERVGWGLFDFHGIRHEAQELWSLSVSCLATAKRATIPQGEDF